MDPTIGENVRYKRYLHEKFKDFLGNPKVLEQFEKVRDYKSILEMAMKVLSTDAVINKNTNFFKKLEDALSNLKKIYDKINNPDICDISDDDSDQESKLNVEKCQETVERALRANEESLSQEISNSQHTQLNKQPQKNSSTPAQPKNHDEQIQQSSTLPSVNPFLMFQNPFIPSNSFDYSSMMYSMLMAAQMNQMMMNPAFFNSLPAMNQMPLFNQMQGLNRVQSFNNAQPSSFNQFNLPSTPLPMNINFFNSNQSKNLKHQNQKPSNVPQTTREFYHENQYKTTEQKQRMNEAEKRKYANSQKQSANKSHKKTKYDTPSANKDNKQSKLNAPGKSATSRKINDKNDQYDGPASNVNTNYGRQCNFLSTTQHDQPQSILKKKNSSDKSINEKKVTFNIPSDNESDSDYEPTSKPSHKTSPKKKKKITLNEYKAANGLKITSVSSQYKIKSLRDRPCDANNNNNKSDDPALLHLPIFVKEEPVDPPLQEKLIFNENEAMIREEIIPKMELCDNFNAETGGIVDESMRSINDMMIREMNEINNVKDEIAMTPLNNELENQSCSLQIENIRSLTPTLGSERFGDLEECNVKEEEIIPFYPPANIQTKDIKVSNSYCH